MNDESTRWIAVATLAQRIGVSQNTIWRWTREHRFPPPVRLTLRCTRWSLEEVREWEALQMAAAAGEQTCESWRTAPTMQSNNH